MMPCYRCSRPSCAAGQTYVAICCASPRRCAVLNLRSPRVCGNTIRFPCVAHDLSDIVSS